MNLNEYRALRLSTASDDKLTMPDIIEVVESSMEINKSMKLEDIVEKVHKATGIDLDKELHKAVFGELRKLEKQKKVSHVDHGFWQKN